MQPYLNLNRNSNIIEYENGPNYIIVKFATGYWKTYKYTEESAGVDTIREMQMLAESGKGLHTYISKNKPEYAKKN